MKKTNNYFGRVLVALVLSVGLVVTACGGSSSGTSSASQDPTKVSNGPITISIKGITESTVEITAILDVDKMGDCDKVGYVISTDKDLDIQNRNSVVVGVKRQPYSEIIRGLSYSTKYYYTAFVVRNGVCSYGEVKEFTTENINGTDLTKNSPANCYIVSEAGTYIFKTIKGNSFTSVGTVDKAEVLWESFGTSTTPSVGDLIENVYWNKDCVAFDTPSTFKKGNAVIAAKDAEGNILWSWHIWLTDQPAEHVYNNNAGTMMDRNLGATSATPGDVGALGLLYQWGRKDPFLGSSSIHYESMELAASTLTWPSAVESTSSTGTIDYVTSNPTTFVGSNENNNDWYYSDVRYETDDTRWQSVKTIYDPCPAGWRVPDGGDDGVWSTAGFDDTTYNSTNEGMNFSGKFGSASTIWYPASGFRNDHDGGLDDVGNDGSYWSVTPSSSFAYFLYFYYNGRVYPSSNYGRAYGYAVRCLQE